MIYILAANQIDATHYATHELNVDIRTQVRQARAVIGRDHLRGFRFKDGDCVYETEQFPENPKAEIILQEVRMMAITSNAHITWSGRSLAEAIDPVPDLSDSTAVEEWLSR